MKKFILFILSILFTVSCASNSIIMNQNSNLKEIHINKITTSDLKISDLNNYILVLNKGDKIPLKIKIDTNFIDIDQKEISIVAKQKIFFLVKVPKKITDKDLEDLKNENINDILAKLKIYVSKDRKKWGLITDPSALDDIFDNPKGSITFNFSLSKKTGMKGNFNLTAK